MITALKIWLIFNEFVALAYLFNIKGGGLDHEEIDGTTANHL